MRLKLVLIASLAASILGAGGCIAIILAAFASLKPLTTPGVLVVLAYSLPLVTTLLASIFVYRHTARRRRLQAALTAILSLLLALAFFIAASIITSSREPIQPEPALPRNVG